MLEIVKFNKSVYRYRSESDEIGLIYNLRYGDIIFIKGKTKIFIELLIEKNYLEININNPVANYLYKNNIIICENGK